MERTKSQYYTIEDIDVEEYQYRKTKDSDWVSVIKHNAGITEESLKIFEKVKHQYENFVYAEVGVFDDSNHRYLLLKDELDNGFTLPDAHQDMEEKARMEHLKYLMNQGLILMTVLRFVQELLQYTIQVLDFYTRNLI